MSIITFLTITDTNSMTITKTLRDRLHLKIPTRTLQCGHEKFPFLFSSKTSKQLMQNRPE